MSKKNTQNYIIFTIDSGSVGGLIVERSYDVKTKKYVYHNIFTIDKSIINIQQVDIKTFFNRTLRVFSNVAETVYKQVNAEIAGIYISVAAPWISLQKRITHFEKENEFIFTKELANSLINKELNEPPHHTRDFREYHDLSLVERRTINVYTNGYQTDNPYGKKVKDVDIHSLIGVMSIKTKNAFLHVIEKAFHRGAEFISNSFMTYYSVSKIFPKEESMVLIDVSGELTEISIIINKHIQKIGTLPVGDYHIVRYLADELDIPYQKAKSLILMYHEDKLDDAFRDSIERAMEKSFIAWFRYFYNFLDEVSLEYLVPDTFLMFAPQYIRPWFSERLFASEEIGEHMNANKDISILDAHVLWKNIKKTDRFNIQHLKLAICLDFIETFIEEKTMNKNA